ncbi:MAG: sulfatase [Planctomycetes bacterium]|nr:sulfatase [Planctomycetota bacterium]
MRRANRGKAAWDVAIRGPGGAMALAAAVGVILAINATDAFATPAQEVLRASPGKTGSEDRAADRLNILLFTADDLHDESVGAFGGRPEGLTPRLDRFARQGMRFDRAHVNAAICAPSRAVIATGLYSHRSGAMGFFKARAGTPDIVTTFQRAGYLAGILGKVGHSTPTDSMRWDYEFDQKDLGNGRNPEIYHQRSRTFLERCRKEGKPFYFMVNSHDPHRPYCNPERLTAGAAMPSRIYKPSEVAVPGFLPDLPGVREELSQYLNSARRLDDTFGRVLDALEESGFARSTLVVFLSDNGIAVPFAKCNTWFHSTRTPLLVRWPGVVEAGSENRGDFVSGVDLFPTFLEAAGVVGPESLDGRSFVPLLRGKTQTGRDHVFTQIDKKAGGDAVPMRCVQSRRYGYIYSPFSDGRHVYRNNNEGLCMKAMQEAARSDPAVAARIALFRYRVPEELYDLEKDPDCLKNLIDSPEHRKAIDALRARLHAWMEATADPMLEAFLNRSDRAAVDAAMRNAYGAPAADAPRGKKRQQETKAKAARD